MPLFLRAISSYRDDLPRIVLELLLIVLQTVVGLLQPFPLAILIGTVLATAHNANWVERVFYHFVGRENRLAQILVLAAAMLVLRLLQEVILMYQTLLRIRIGYSGLMRVRCMQMGVPIGDVFATLQVFLGGLYANDFNKFGRTW